MLGTFAIEGVPFTVARGRVVPGLPAQHIIRADTGAHVSLAYPDADGFLFDDRSSGYRVNADGSVERFKSKRDYYLAREHAGWPCRRRRRARA